MSKRRLPWYPRCPDEFRAETGLMSLSEKGAYGELMDEYWISGPLPDDPTALARVVRVSSKNWGRLWRKLSPQFVRTICPQTGMAVWRHTALDVLKEAARITSERNAMKGRKGGLASRGRNNVERYIIQTLAQAAAQAPAKPVGDTTNKVSKEEASQTDSRKFHASPYLIASEKRRRERQ